MKLPYLTRIIPTILIALVCFSNITTQLFAKKQKAPRTAVYSEVSKDYQREFHTTGKVKAETYAFGEGTCWDKESEGDPSLKALSFKDMCEILADALAEKEYFPTPSPEETDLMILVHWGKTLPFDDGIGEQAIDQLGEFDFDDPYFDDGNFTQMMMLMGSNLDHRQQVNSFNSQLIGFDHQYKKLKSIYDANPMFSGDMYQILYELEEPRYFVILQAFDFQKMWKEKTKKLLWLTKFSIQAKGKNFHEELSSMALSASQSFGDKNKKLLRSQTPGRVTIGELEFLGTEDK